MLIRRRRHLHHKDVTPLDGLDFIEPVRVRTVEFGNDQRLADTGVPMQHHAGHPRSRGHFEQSPSSRSSAWLARG
jgi:hypothetical protein